MLSSSLYRLDACLPVAIVISFTMSRRPWFANKGGAPAAKSKAASSAADAAVDTFARFYKQLTADSPDGLHSATGKEEEDETDEESKQGSHRHSPKHAAATSTGEQRERVLRLFLRQDSEYYSVHGDAAYFVADNYNRTRVDIRSEHTTFRGAHSINCVGLCCTLSPQPPADTSLLYCAVVGGVVVSSFHG